MLLTTEENAALNLRALYQDYGYSFFRMRRFEEYDFYAGKKGFLSSRHILSFTDLNGKLMALRPDVTLSIIKNVTQGKYYYDEKVYRVPKNSDTFREIPQVGIENVGNLDGEGVREVVTLALLSLETIAEGRDFVLDVADAGIVASLMPELHKAEILACLAGKNIHGLRELDAPDELIALAENPPEKLEILDNLNYRPEVHIDFSTVSNLRYYNGIVFKGYIEGLHEAVLSGGQYDMGMGMGMGFAVYLDVIGNWRGGND